MRIFWCLAVFAIFGVAGQAQEAKVLRYLQFRDGSILRLPLVDENWQITMIGPDGSIADAKVPLSSLQSLTLTPEKGIAKKRTLLTAVRKLGSEEFRYREQAQTQILKLGPGIVQDLETCLTFTTDIEAQARLKDILGQWRKQPGPEAGPAIFDIFHRQKTYWGDLGEAGIPVLVKGKMYRLQRKDVQAMTVAAPAGLELLAGGFPGPSGFRRLQAQDFPPNCIEEPFSATPDGRPLQVGENIEKLFVKKGFVLSTSIAGSYVSVNQFQVLGKSRGLSAATHRPLWEGEVTVRFVQPGRADLPAGVTHFGCYIAAVVPGGTALVAYDLAGRELGRIETQANGHTFLGVRSAIPIHRVRFIPNLQLDRDYTLDDFIFTPPQTPEARHPEKFTVFLAGGDRLVCADVGFDRNSVHLYGMPGDLPDFILARDQVLRINAPDQGRPPEALPPGVFAELRDGSVLFGTQPKDKRGQPVFARRHILQEPAHLVGLWSNEFPRLTEKPQPGQAVVWDAEQKKWQALAKVRFREDIELWKTMTDSQVVPYQKLGPLWLSSPAADPAAGWHIRTKGGDDLVSAHPEKLAGRLSRELQGVWQGQPLRLPSSELSSIYQVLRKP